MKTRLEIVLAVLLGAALMAIVAQRVGTAHAAPLRTNQELSGMLGRACAYKAGGGTLVDCSAGVVYSSQLSANYRYVIQSHVGAVYFRQGA